MQETERFSGKKAQTGRSVHPSSGLQSFQLVSNLTEVEVTTQRAGSDIFPKTRWSLVLQASEKNEQVAQRALSDLCEIYWQPIYVYIRGRGWSVEEAQDLTQGFFAHFLHQKSLQRADHGRGKLRAYLLGAVKNFLGSEYRKINAHKRGGKAQVLSLDHDEGELQLKNLTTTGRTPEELFDQTWVRAQISIVVEQLEGDYHKAGRQQVFEAIRPNLMSESELKPQRVLARELGVSLAAIKVEIFRLRQRFRQLLEREIEQTLDEEEEVAEEVKYLLAIWEG